MSVRALLGRLSACTTQPVGRAHTRCCPLPEGVWFTVASPARRKSPSEPFAASPGTPADHARQLQAVVMPGQGELPLLGADKPRQGARYHRVESRFIPRAVTATRARSRRAVRSMTMPAKPCGVSVFRGPFFRSFAQGARLCGQRAASEHEPARASARGTVPVLTPGEVTLCSTTPGSGLPPFTRVAAGSGSGCLTIAAGATSRDRRGHDRHRSPACPAWTEARRTFFHPVPWVAPLHARWIARRGPQRRSGRLRFTSARAERAISEMRGQRSRNGSLPLTRDAHAFRTMPGRGMRPILVTQDTCSTASAAVPAACRSYLPDTSHAPLRPGACSYPPGLAVRLRPGPPAQSRRPARGTPQRQKALPCLTPVPGDRSRTRPAPLPTRPVPPPQR